MQSSNSQSQPLNNYAEDFSLNHMDGTANMDDNSSEDLFASLQHNEDLMLRLLLEE